ncbi:hypothetical protein Droror1_Dr00026634 [Drosera rotundifolia]
MHSTTHPPHENTNSSNRETKSKLHITFFAGAIRRHHQLHLSNTKPEPRGILKNKRNSPRREIHQTPIHHYQLPSHQSLPLQITTETPNSPPLPNQPHHRGSKSRQPRNHHTTAFKHHSPQSPPSKAVAPPSLEETLAAAPFISSRPRHGKVAVTGQARWLDTRLTVARRTVKTVSEDEDQAAITALREWIQGYCGQNSDLAQDIRTRNAVNDLRARLMACDLERRIWHESCTANVLTEQEAMGFSVEAVESERYGIARGEDQLDEVDIGGWAEVSRPTFVSHNLTLEGKATAGELRNLWRVNEEMLVQTGEKLQKEA